MDNIHGGRYLCRLNIFINMWPVLVITIELMFAGINMFLAQEHQLTMYMLMSTAKIDFSSANLSF